MSSETITLEATKRDILGKQVRGLRNEGQTPAVVHDHGKESIHIAVLEKDLKKVYSSAGKHHTVVLKVDGKSYTTLIKEVTNRPASAQIYHTVFQAVSANETVKTEVPLKLIGEIPAERASLLVLQNLDHVEVEGLPKDLIDVLEIDATGLAEAGDKLTVADVKVPAGITITTDPEQTIATVEIPRDQVAEADAAAAELAEDAGTDGEAEGEAEATEGGGTDSGEGADAHDVQPTDEAKE
jgi:large subunit ribosomal protein L25